MRQNSRTHVRLVVNEAKFNHNKYFLQRREFCGGIITKGRLVRGSESSQFSSQAFLQVALFLPPVSPSSSHNATNRLIKIIARHRIEIVNNIQ